MTRSARRRARSSSLVCWCGAPAQTEMRLASPAGWDVRPFDVCFGHVGFSWWPVAVKVDLGLWMASVGLAWLRDGEGTVVGAAHVSPPV